MKRKLHPETRLDVYRRWYEARDKGNRDASALIEFAWKFPDTSKGARWFQEAVGELIAALVRRLRKDGKSFRHIATLLNRMRVPTRRAGRWYASSVRLCALRPPRIDLSGLDAFRLLCAIYGPKRQDLSWVESVIRSGDSMQEDVGLLWDLHPLMKEPFRLLRGDILLRFRRYERHVRAGKAIPRQERLVSFVRRCWGTRELPYSNLRAALLAEGIRERGILEELSPPPQASKRLSRPLGRGLLDRRLTRDDEVILATGRLETAVTRILCKWFGFSPRSAYRYKPVQKKAPLGSITVTPLDSD